MLVRDWTVKVRRRLSTLVRFYRPCGRWRYWEGLVGAPAWCGGRAESGAVVVLLWKCGRAGLGAVDVLGSGDGGLNVVTGAVRENKAFF